jgi:hypothetical protein
VSISLGSTCNIFQIIRCLPPQQLFAFFFHRAIGSVRKTLSVMGRNRTFSESNNSAAQNDQSIRDRRSPESFREQFSKPRKRQTIDDTFTNALTFLPWGGDIEINGEKIELINTCNFDGVIMVLQALWLASPVGRSYLDDLRKQHDEVIEEVVACITHLGNGDFVRVKTIWVDRLLNKEISSSERIDMIGIINNINNTLIIIFKLL